MSESKQDSQMFVGYEYKEVITNANQISFLIDSYQNFGWEVDHNMPPKITGNIPNPQGTITLRLKRNRKIMNKMELTRLQRNFEFCLKEINHLEKSRESKATMYALIVGILGTAFMAGAVFAVIAEPTKIILSIIFAIPAFAGWILPPFIYKKVERKRELEVNPLIEEKQNEIYELCEKGNKLRNYS